MKLTEELKDQLSIEGYTELQEIPGRGICGLYRFILTVGLVYGIDEIGYRGRWCYPSMTDAKLALALWSGKGDPSGEWIKYKGEGGEYSNSNKTI